MSEAVVQQDIQIAGPYHSCQLMRNNSGELKDRFGRPVRYGLGNISKEHNERIKSSDLIGITTIIITPEMVGQKIGVFTAIEVKEPNWKPGKDPREEAQNNFIQWVLSLGGYAGFAKSVDSFVRIIRK